MPLARSPPLRVPKKTTTSNLRHPEPEHKCIAPHQYLLALEDMQEKCLLAAQNYSTSHPQGARACRLSRQSEQAPRLSLNWLEASYKHSLLHHSHDHGHHAFCFTTSLCFSFILLFAASVFTNAFYTHSAFWWNFSSPVYYLLRLAMGRKQETGRVHVLWERKKVSSHHTGLGRGGFESELVHLCSGRIKGFEGPVDWSREDFCTGSYRFGRAKMTSWNCDCDLVVQIRSPDVLRIGIVIFPCIKRPPRSHVEGPKTSTHKTTTTIASKT
jgi:hypothetical protein